MVTVGEESKDSLPSLLEITNYKHFHKPTYTIYLFNPYKVLSMLKLTAQDKKLIEKYRKKVLRHYPGAFLASVGSKSFTIMQEQDDLTARDILAEFCFAPTNDPIHAWKLAQLVCKTNQNINRTHPLRIEGMNMAEKIARVEARRLKTEIGRESRKFKD